MSRSVPFFRSFLFGTTQSDGSVTKVQDFCKTLTEHDAACSSIQQWITPELKTLLAEIVAHLSVELGGTESSLDGRFDRFRDVFIADATDCTLSAESFEDLPGYGDDHAGLRAIRFLADMTGVRISTNPNPSRVNRAGEIIVRPLVPRHLRSVVFIEVLGNLGVFPVEFVAFVHDLVFEVRPLGLEVGQLGIKRVQSVEFVVEIPLYSFELFDLGVDRGDIDGTHDNLAEVLIWGDSLAGFNWIRARTHPCPNTRTHAHTDEKSSAHFRFE